VAVIARYGRSVFINCPFDDDYVPIFEAIVFTVQALGFEPVSARIRINSGEVRLLKIASLIRRCRYSIHDLSRTELDPSHGLPRFNMPLELGLDLGCKIFNTKYSGKSLLIFDRERYRFQRYVSDIGGQDIAEHGNEPARAIGKVRDWLRAESGLKKICGPATLLDRYQRFRKQLPAICRRLKIEPAELTFVDFTYSIAYWLQRTGL
jgi:hypothetical protein